MRNYVVVDEGERLEVVPHGRHVLLLAAGVRVEDLAHGGRQPHVHRQRHQVRDVDEHPLLQEGIKKKVFNHFLIEL